MADARPVPKGSLGDVPTNDASVFVPINIPTMVGSMTHATREGLRDFTRFAGCDSGGKYGFIASKTRQPVTVHNHRARTSDRSNSKTPQVGLRCIVLLGGRPELSPINCVYGSKFGKAHMPANLLLIFVGVCAGDLRISCRNLRDRHWAVAEPRHRRGEDSLLRRRRTPR